MPCPPPKPQPPILPVRLPQAKLLYLLVCASGTSCTSINNGDGDNLLSTMLSASHILFHLILPYKVNIIIPFYYKQLRPTEVKGAPGHTASE